MCVTRMNAKQSSAEVPIRELFSGLCVAHRSIIYSIGCNVVCMCVYVFASCQIRDTTCSICVPLCFHQAGFIGAWGEWHSSVHHLEDNHTALAYLVASELYKWWPRGDRQVLVRVPRYKEDWLLKQSLTGFSHWKRGVVGEMTQHSSAAFARIGFHDDGFMNPPSDGGTW